MKQNGGDIIGVGSYGCVFKPPLKCKNKTRKKRGISKLMIQENGLDEILITQRLLKKSNKFPNIENILFCHKVSVYLTIYHPKMNDKCNANVMKI